MNKKNVGILIFDDVEVLDFSGPFEVFSRTSIKKGTQSRLDEKFSPFNTFTFSIDGKVITATGGMKVIPSYSVFNMPRIDIIIIPGGLGTRKLLNNEETILWIKDLPNKAAMIASVCTGSLLLAKAGLLRNKQATTHWSAIELLQSIDKSINIMKKNRIVEDTIITSAGVSSGIDMAFYIVSKFYGERVAQNTAKYIEFNRSQNIISEIK
tara:strand:+ start:3396 stop:4025 length:630 start_codon:yes stop_codon:yes gene_type:complete